jgi:hypothetical protein
MSAQLTLTRSSSLVSTTSTLIGSKEEAKGSKLSLAPSQNGLADLEKQALATSVPTVGILEKFAGAKKSIASTAQKAASMLSKPKAAVIKESKIEVPELEKSISSVELESQLPVQAAVSGKSSFAHMFLRSGGLIGATVGLTAGLGGVLGGFSTVGPLSELDPTHGFMAALIGIAFTVQGNVAGGLIQNKIENSKIL